MLRTKSVWTGIDQHRDGLRILVTRFRGRRLPGSRYHVWMPSLGPSERLLRARQSGRMSWAQFAREYRKELRMGGRIDSRNRTIKNHGQKFTLRLLARLAKTQHVTVMCQCAEAEEQCHRHVLWREIRRNR